MSSPLISSLLTWYDSDVSPLRCHPGPKGGEGEAMETSEQIRDGDIRLAAQTSWESPVPGSSDLCIRRGETTAALTFPGFSVSHAESFLGFTPWRKMFLQKPVNMPRAPASVFRPGFSDRATWGWGIRQKVPVSRGPPNPCGICRRAWVPAS